MPAQMPQEQRIKTTATRSFLSPLLYKLNLTQAYVGKQCRISRGNMSSGLAETRPFTPKTQKLLAKVLGMNKNQQNELKEICDTARSFVVLDFEPCSDVQKQLALKLSYVLPKLSKTKCAKLLSLL